MATTVIINGQEVTVLDPSDGGFDPAFANFLLALARQQTPVQQDEASIDSDTEG